MRRIAITIICILLFLFVFPSVVFGASLPPFCWADVFFSEINPSNVVVGQEINGELVIEVTCQNADFCTGEPFIDYGSGDEALSGGKCACQATVPSKQVRCSYNFTHTFDAAGEYNLTPRVREWSGGFISTSPMFSGPSVKINVFEAPSPGPGTGAGNPLSTSTIAGLVKTGTNVIYIIVYALTVLFIMLGGVMLITSSGNPEQVTKGRKIVLYTIIAFAILIIARGIVNLILMIIDVPTRI